MRWALDTRGRWPFILTVSIASLKTKINALQIILESKSGIWKPNSNSIEGAWQPAASLQIGEVLVQLHSLHESSYLVDILLWSSGRMVPLDAGCDCVGI